MILLSQAESMFKSSNNNKLIVGDNMPLESNVERKEKKNKFLSNGFCVSLRHTKKRLIQSHIYKRNQFCSFVFTNTYVPTRHQIRCFLEHFFLRCPTKHILRRRHYTRFLFLFFIMWIFRTYLCSCQPASNIHIQSNTYDTYGRK